MGNVDRSEDHRRQRTANTCPSPSARRHVGCRSRLGTGRSDQRRSGSDKSGQATTSSSSRSPASTTSTRLPRCKQALRSAIAAGARTSVVDLTETTFLDSTMLHVLLSARSELRDGRRLLLVTDNPTIKRVFEITGTDRLFDFYPSRRAAEQEARPR